MRTHALLLASSAAALLTLVAARPARALGPVDIEIAGKVGFGTNNLGFGAGGRAGVSIFGLYGGVNLVEYPSVGGGGAGIPSVGVLAYGGEVGYGLKIAIITIRPLVGFGDLNSSIGNGGSFYIQPGGLLQLNLGLLIVGVDAGALIQTASGNSGAALTVDGQIGVKF